jgi:prepilin peptidase CpaA
MLAGLGFTLLLAGACVSDLRWRRIPNSLVAALAIAGIVYAVATRPVDLALGMTLGGGAVGLALWLPFWAARVLGAGDVKLASAAGMWLGIAGAVEASLLAAVAGGVLGIWALVRRSGPAAGLIRFGTWLTASRVTGAVAPELTPSEQRVPYGLAIAAGAVVAAWIPGLLW